MVPLIYFAGRDKYAEGRGHMLIKLFSLIKVADAGGKEVDQGTLPRIWPRRSGFRLRL